MYLYEEILLKQLCKDNDNNYSDLLQNKCYKALEQIQLILKDDLLTDADCFMKIEEIVCVFEQLGCGCGTRHDFG